MKLVTKQTYQIFWQHARRYRILFWAVVIGISGGVVMGTITPIYYKKFFDELTGTPTYDGLLKIILFILILNAVQWLLWRGATFANNYFQPRVMADLTNSSFDYLHNHSFGFFINRFVGGLVRKVGRLIRAFEEISDSFYWNLIPMAIRIASILVVLAYFYPVLSLVILGWCTVYLVINYFLTIKKLKLDVVAAEADTEVTAYLADTITNQANVKIFTSLPYEKGGFGQATNKQYRASLRSWNFDAWVDTVQGTLMVSLEFLMFYIALRLWQRGAVTVGDFVLLQIYVIQIFERLWDFGRVIRRIYRNLADAEEMVEILHTRHQIQDRPGAHTLIIKQGKVDFRNVSFTYSQNLPVVKKFDLKIAPREKIGLVGPSGAGKSTLVSLLFRFYDVSSGGIYFDDQNIAEVTQDSLRQQISLVPQDPILFHRTLLENIRYGRQAAADDEVVKASKLAHCDEFISRLPDKYNTYVGERGVKLSGGERQRVAIARAILKNAPILVLDEATSSLDSQVEAMIQDALKNLMQGKTAIVIAHRLSTIMRLDRIVVIDNGQVKEIGTHQTLLEKSSGLYKTLWQLQAGGFIV
ncbi:TPA: ABC transporter ATP-binding protein [Patescibacteria group bacterium]|nr:ABC transporter ATP-binding protein [Patescibacteria group bacterium]